jgi:hypothetical protein
MKKFFAVLFGIILLVIFVALVIITFVITTLSKIMTWITGIAQIGLEKLKVSIQY